MARKLLLVLAAASIAVITASAPAPASYWVEVPVTGLNGYYGWGLTQTVGTFTASVNPVEIIQARLRIIGNLVWPSYYGCPGGNYLVNGVYFYATMPASSGEWVTNTTYVDQRFAFITWLDFSPADGATWDFLSGGTGTVCLTGWARALPEGCRYDHGSSDTTAEVTEAYILVELRDPTPVHQTSWGRIKILLAE